MRKKKKYASKKNNSEKECVPLQLKDIFVI